MALNEIMYTPKPPKGGLGGAIGSIVGSIAGLGAVAAAPFTGGTSLAALPAVLGGVSAAAPVVGSLADPVKEGAQGDNIQLMDKKPAEQTTALDRMANHPAIQMASLQEAKQALSTEPSIPTPVALKMQADFDTAHAELSKRLKTVNV